MSWLDDNKNFLMGTGALGLGLLIFFQNCSGNFESAGIKSNSSNQGAQSAEKCTTSQICQFVNGTGIRICNTDGTLAGCDVMACFDGFRHEGNACVPVSCTPGSTQACAEGNKVGNKICKTNGSGYDPCELTACAEGYYLSGNECLTNCAPNSVVDCSDETGRGMKACNSDGKGYEACQFSSCRPSFILNNRKCLPGAACGGSNGQAFTQKPTADLCLRGDVNNWNDVGSYQWQWACKLSQTFAVCNAWQATQVRCSHYAGFNNDGSFVYFHKMYFLSDQMMTPKECFDSFMQHMEGYRLETASRCPTVPNYLPGRTEIH